MSYLTGSTSVSVDVAIYDDSGLPVASLVAATFPAVKFSRAGANADVTISLSDLSTLASAWSSGGLKERGEGRYRLDLPDAVFASAGAVTLRGEASAKRLLAPVIRVGELDRLDVAVSTRLEGGVYAAPDNATISAIATKTSQLTFSGANVNASIAAITAGVITSAAFSVSAIAGVASGILEKIDQTWRRFFKRARMTRTSLKTFADNGTTPLTTQVLSNDGSVQDQGAAT